MVTERKRKERKDTFSRTGWLPDCSSSYFPSNSFGSSPCSFLPLQLHLFPLLFSRLSPTRPRRHLAFTSHYTVWDDESAVYLSVSIQCCSCLQVRRRRLSTHALSLSLSHTQTQTYKHGLISFQRHTHSFHFLCPSIAVSLLIRGHLTENMQSGVFSSRVLLSRWGSRDSRYFIYTRAR